MDYESCVSPVVYDFIFTLILLTAPHSEVIREKGSPKEGFRQGRSVSP